MKQGSTDTTTFYLTPAAIAEQCVNAKRHGQRWVAKCPAHKDKTASLSIDKGRKATLVHCHAGCTTRMVLDALELSMEMLYYDYNPNASSPHSLSSLKLRQMVRDKTPPTIHELMPHRTLEDVLAVVMPSSVRVWVWVKLRWADWFEMPYPEAMKKHWVVTDAICADLMRNEIDGGYDYTVAERHRLRDRLEDEWELHGPPNSP